MATSFQALKDARAGRHQGKAQASSSSSSSTASSSVVHESKPPAVSQTTSPTQQSGHTLRTSDEAQVQLSQTSTSTKNDTAASAVSDRLNQIDLGERDEIEALYQDELDKWDVGIRTIPGRGRGLMAKKGFKPGSRILKTIPPISLLSTSHLLNTCSGCFLTLREKSIRLAHTGEAHKDEKIRLSRCAGCKALHYCSRECQIQDWPNHKHECKALQRLRTMYFRSFPTKKEDGTDVEWAGPEMVRALGRMIWKRKDERLKNGGKDGDWWNRIASMESHRRIVSEQELVRIGQQIQHLRHYLGAARPLQPGEDVERLEPVDLADFGFGSVAEIMDVASAFPVNSFTLSSPSLSALGVSTSPLVALANHSCDPNAVVVFPEGRDMEVIALCDITPGEEILTSYIDVSTPYEDRQAELLGRYRFKCECTLCEKSKDERWIDPRWCVSHVGCDEKGKGKMPGSSAAGSTSTSCDACGKSFEVEMGLLRPLLQEGKQLLSQDESNALERSYGLSKLSSLIPALQAKLPASSEPLLGLYRLHALLLNPPRTIATLNLATSHLALASSGAEIAYPRNHPTPAVIKAEWGKMLSYDKLHRDAALEAGQKGDQKSSTELNKEARKRLEQSVGVMSDAVNDLRRGMGGAGGVTAMELEGLIGGIQAELGYGSKR
ncbi:hypothetical protein IAR55_004191 [Kwoniella newhampshirensis]|uniref:SET domain-containing protein n=1 Tax=Kwoniella newhampshirensis TaxID=1651941 RepID=A0AAW0YLR2_9TREE